MRKKFLLIMLTVTVLLAATVLCACGGDSTGDNKGNGTGDKDVLDGWKTIESPTPVDVYNKLLGGAVTMASDLSKHKINSHPKIGLDGKLKVNINGNEFWATIKMNYNDKDRASTMFAFQLTSEEDSYEDMIVGAFVKSEQLYVAIGETKFSVPLPYTVWEEFFPFDIDKDMQVSDVAAVLALVFDLNKFIEGKKRTMGTVEELNYKIDINIPRSLAKLVAFLDKQIENGTISNLDFSGYEYVIKGLTGVTFADIAEGNFPASALKIDFSLRNLKMDAFKIDLEINNLPNGGMLFEEDRLAIGAELVNFFVSTKQNVSIPFVNADYDSERAKYVFYRDNAFRLSLDTVKTIQELDGPGIPYRVDLTVKVFQEDSIHNYAFIEYKNKQTGKIDYAFYAYEDIGYFFSQVDGEFVCTLKLPFALSDLAEQTLYNNFGGESEFDILAAIGYILEQLKIGDESFMFDFDSGFFDVLWYNFFDMVDYVNARFEENIREEGQPVETLLGFISNNPSKITFRYDTMFLSTVASSEARLKDTIATIKNKGRNALVSLEEKTEPAESQESEDTQDAE